MMRSNLAARLVGAAALVGVALSMTSCASEESILFAVPDAGNEDFVTPPGGACTENAACKVKFSTDIFKAILDGSAGCTGSLCHGGDTPQGNMVLKTGDAAGAYSEFINYTLKKTPGPAGPYIDRCHPKTSSLLCNTALSDGENPYKKCGTLMPSNNKKLTKAQLDTLAEWIECGAPNN